jgi:hypothetical protein
MKVKITVTVDIDPEVWDSLYFGTGTPSAKAIREDVQASAENAIQSHFEQVGVLL